MSMDYQKTADALSAFILAYEQLCRSKTNHGVTLIHDQTTFNNTAFNLASAIAAAAKGLVETQREIDVLDGALRREHAEKKALEEKLEEALKEKGKTKGRRGDAISDT